MNLDIEKDYYNRLTNESIPYFLARLGTQNLRETRLALEELSYRYLTLASLEYGLFGNMEACKKNLELFKDYEFQYVKAIIENDPSLKLITNKFPQVLHALCTGDSNFYLEYVKFLDDHANYEEKPSKHGSEWLYRALAWIILERNLDQVPDALEKAKASFNPKGQYKAMYPYVLMLEAIWEKDEKKFHENLEIAAQKYSRQTNGTFDAPYEKFLCLDGIGLCQLAKHKGMKVNFDHKYIPAELIK